MLKYMRLQNRVRWTLCLSLICLPVAPCAWTPTGNKDNILVCRPKTKPGQDVQDAFQEAFQGLSQELGDEFELTDFQLDGSTTVVDLEQQIIQVQPKLIVLMENRTVNLFKRYQQAQAEGSSFPPALILMALNITKEINRVQHAIGISYDIPAIVSISQLNSLMRDPINRVGVLYREELSNYFEEEAAQCRQEEIELVGIKITEAELNPKLVRQKLNDLIKRKKVDAIWILNDSVIIQRDYLRRVWLPLLRSSRKPILVGARPLLGIGHFGVFPDHVDMGAQAAEIIFDIQEQNWSLEGFTQVVVPVGVIKGVNLRTVTNRLKINKEVLAEMDITLEKEQDLED